MRGKTPTTVVIGCGVRSSGDDAAGLLVVDGLLLVADFGCQFRSYDAGWPPGFLTDMPADALLIFVAAVHNNAAPGTICCVKLPSKSVRCRHLHSRGPDAVELDEELQLARKVHGAAPRTFLLGIEAVQYQGDTLSERVRAAVDEIVRNFPRYLKLASDLA